MQVNDANRNRRHIGLLAIVCLLWQLAIAPNIALGNGRANVALVFAATIALMIGGRTGVACGFAAGLVFDLSTTGPIGLMALLLTVLSFALGREQRDRITDDAIGSVALVAMGALVVSLAYHMTMFVLGQADSLIDVLFLRTLPTALLTTACYLPIALLLGRSASFGGGGRRGHGSHYTLGGR